MPPQVIGLGEVMLLLVAEQHGPLREATTFRRHVAGAEANVAVGLTRLGHQAGYVTRLGDDEFGQAIAFRLRGEGVDLSHTTFDPTAPTGLGIQPLRRAGDDGRRRPGRPPLRRGHLRPGRRGRHPPLT